MSLLRSRVCSLTVRKLPTSLISRFMVDSWLPGSSLPRGPASPSALTADSLLSVEDGVGWGGVGWGGVAEAPGFGWEASSCITALHRLSHVCVYAEFHSFAYLVALCSSLLAHGQSSCHFLFPRESS